MADPDKPIDETVVDFVYKQAGRGASAYGYYKKIKNAKNYYNIVKGLTDEDTRSGSLLQGSFEAVKLIGGKALGNNFFFDYHKKHFEVLANALNASETFDHAVALLDQAVTAADSSEALTHGLDVFGQRKNALKLAYAGRLTGPIRTLRENAINPATVQKDLADSGATIQSISATVTTDLVQWRNDACDLCFDCMQTFYLVGAEYMATLKAMTQYNAKVKKMRDSDSNFNYIAGKGLEKRRDEEIVWRELQRQNNPNRPDPLAVADPTEYAQRQMDKVEGVLLTLTTFCDVAMSDDAWNPDTINRKLGSL
jgi:hypothetical protein